MYRPAEAGGGVGIRQEVKEEVLGILDKRQRRRTQELEIGNSKRARSMGKHTPSQAEFKPRLSDRPPRTSSFYCTTFSQPRFQGFRGNKFGQIK